MGVLDGPDRIGVLGGRAAVRALGVLVDLGVALAAKVRLAVDPDGWRVDVLGVSLGGVKTYHDVHLRLLVDDDGRRLRAAECHLPVSVSSDTMLTGPVSFMVTLVPFFEMLPRELSVKKNPMTLTLDW